MPKERVIFRIQGMHCDSCAVLINKTLQNLKGVNFAQANFGTEKLILEYDPEITPLEKITEIIKKLGYSLIIPKAAQEEETLMEEAREKEIRSLKIRVIASFLLAPPIIFYYMAVHMFNLEHIHALCLGGGGFF